MNPLNVERHDPKTIGFLEADPLRMGLLFLDNRLISNSFS